MPELDVLNALLGAGVGFAAQGVVRAIVAVRQRFKSEFSGRIYGVLPAYGEKEQRIDKMRVRQRGQHLTGTIRRIAPQAERGRKWKVVGYSYGNVVVSLFHIADLRHDATSYGVAVLHRDPDIRVTPVWRGYYIRPGSLDFDEIVSDEKALTRYPLTCQKVNPREQVSGTKARTPSR